MSETYITCRELLDFLDDYLADTQLSEVRREFERHLSVCPPCRYYLRTYQDTIKLARSVCDPSAHPADLPESVPAELVRAILAARAKEHP